MDTLKQNSGTHIETDLLLLRPIVMEDAPSLLELFSDSTTMRYFPSTKDLNETEEWVKETQQRKDRDGHTFLLVVRKDDTATLGYCGLILQQDVDGTDEIEVGYGLKRKYWHFGYATQAAAACLTHGFSTLNLNRIISLIRPENAASIAVAKRNGLQCEKRVERWGYLHDVYAIDRIEFAAFNGGIRT
ncbi:MAG: GNAT family N-acetyltransferase [Deltaproteobacteria bacterium]|nr:GNAT family N-acetyltransferase [Deltaproteobacteria bacterium]